MSAKPSIYWIETIADALESEGIKATTQQIENIAECVEANHDMYGEYHGHQNIPNPLSSELSEARKELISERRKQTCELCHGSGNLQRFFGYTARSIDLTTCYKCNGAGRK